MQTNPIWRPLFFFWINKEFFFSYLLGNVTISLLSVYVVPKQSCLHSALLIMTTESMLSKRQVLRFTTMALFFLLKLFSSHNYCILYFRPVCEVKQNYLAYLSIRLISSFICLCIFKRLKCYRYQPFCNSVSYPDFWYCCCYIVMALVGKNPCVFCLRQYLTFIRSATNRCYSTLFDSIESTPSQQKSIEDFFAENLRKIPEQPADPKRLRVGVIGMPNVGKSTLINSLTGRNHLATSSRIDTTRNNILAILSEDNYQIEFQDTPGIHNRQKSKKICGSLRNSYLPGHCLEKADLALVVVDLSEKRTSKGYLQPEILLHLMKHPEVPAVLVLNKIDKISYKNNVLPLISDFTAGVVNGIPLQNKVLNKNPPKAISLPKIETEVLHALDKLEKFKSTNDVSLGNKTELKVLKQLRSCKGWPHFKEVFVISALRRNMPRLKTYLKAKALSEPWKYHSDMITDASPYDMVIDIVRSSMLENLWKEVPYLTNITIANWVENNNHVEIFIDLICQTVRHLRIVERASNIISFGAEKRLEKVFPVEVDIRITVHYAPELV